MDQNQMFKQAVEINQTMFNNFSQALILLQGQFERIANSAIYQADWLTDEGNKATENWDKSFME